jgi:hypothetical protein
MLFSLTGYRAQSEPRFSMTAFDAVRMLDGGAFIFNERF